jgi:hypothetical protein
MKTPKLYLLCTHKKFRERLDFRQVEKINEPMEE